MKEGRARGPLHTAMAGLALVVGLWLATGGLGAQAALHQPFEDLVARYLREVRGIDGREPDDMSAASYERDLATRRRILTALPRPGAGRRYRPV